ncbi:MAG TPA: HD domain-containing protein [Solirubrobacterales bacterium]|nr:HD domain-containing protein [Solirubrobacterales bacterium]
MSALIGEIGTIEWCRRTNGILGRGERARYMAAVALATARALPRMLRGRSGSPGGPDPSRLAPPDTAFAREVVEACSGLEPMTFEHSYRSYLFARALGELEGLACDEEALFAATMFHDAAFPRIDELEGKCFTLAGAEEAERFLASSSLDRSLHRDVLDAITLHLNPRVPREQGALQHLAKDGIGLDVIGQRAWELDRAGIERTFGDHPRHGFNAKAEGLLRTNARRAPGCRAGAAFATGFGQALKTSPWAARDRRD